MEKGTKLVLEQVVTTIASVADTSGEQFVAYYDRLMPCLKYIIQNANTEELKMLRGKAIECVSLIGLAVGAEKVSWIFFVILNLTHTYSLFILLCSNTETQLLIHNPFSGSLSPFDP